MQQPFNPVEGGECHKLARESVYRHSLARFGTYALKLQQNRQR